MNNIIATSTHVLSAYPIHEAIEVIKKEGYGAIEIWYNEFIKQEKEGTTSYAKIKKALIKTGLKGVIHTATRFPNGRRINPSSKNESYRKRSIKLNLDAINFARQCGFHLINIHPGRMDNADDNPKDYWPLLKEAFKEFVAAAEEANVILAVELMEQRPKEYFFHAHDLKRLHSYFNSDYLGATLDIIHSFTHGEEFPHIHMDELGEIHLRHFHASGFYGKKGKSHCPFKMDENHQDYFAKLLKKIILNYDGMITVEGGLKGILYGSRENQLNAIKDNIIFVRSAVGGI